MNQKGIAPLLILIGIAALIAVLVFAYGYFVASRNLPDQNSTSSNDQTALNQKANIQDCSDTDYTGCDTSANFMQWKDDGERNPPANSSSQSTIIEK